MRRPVGTARGGFSMVEAIIAITISTMVVFLASSVFLVQNDFYSFLLQRSRAQDNARVFLDVVEREVGSLVGSALLSAEPTRMLVRSPQTLGGVCAVNGAIAHIHWAAINSLDPENASGIGYRDATGSWSFFPADVDGMVHDKGPASANLCAMAGADTTGAGQQQFTKLRFLGSVLGGMPPPGSVLMTYDEVELVIAPSTLDPNLLALFRGPVGDDLTEYTTGVSVAARFEYRRGNTWTGSVPPGQLDQVDAVRIIAATHQPSESGVGTDAEFELTVDLPLRNR